MRQKLNIWKLEQISKKSYSLIFQLENQKLIPKIVSSKIIKAQDKPGTQPLNMGLSLKFDTHNVYNTSLYNSVQDR